MKGKKTIVVGLAILLSLSISTVTSKGDKLSVVYTFESTLGGCGEFLIKDTQVLAIPGEPLTPYKAARILLPQGTEAKNIKVNTGTPVVQEGFDIPWGQPPCTFSDIPVTVGRNEDIYTSDSLYPKEVFQVIGVDYCKGFAILNLHLFPVQYKPKSGTVIFYPEMTVEVQFGKGTKNELYRGLVSDKEDVRGMVDNPDVLATYEDGPAPLATEEYIIITNDTMLSAFQTLATWKAGWVNGATVYTVAWISSNYTGTDNQMKMRNFIIDKYTNNGCKYVLLGGDVSAVPYRGFYVSTGGYTDSDMLADMYFGHLDGSHNSDGDSYYGEINDGVDFGAEVAIGRAPCETVTEAQNFVNKVIAFEQADKPKRILFHQSRIQTGNIPDSRCLAYNSDDYIPGDYTIDYLFEENDTVTKLAWIQHWAQNPLIVVHIGQGSTSAYYINYEVGGTVSWYSTDIPSMTNTFWPIQISIASFAGQIEAEDCLGEEYVKRCKVFAFIGLDSYAWYSTGNACMYSGEFAVAIFRAIFSDGKQKLGDALNKGKSYLASSAQSNSTYRWCFYEINLIGDPETPILTTRPSYATITITSPEEGETVSGKITIETETDSEVTAVMFYVDSTWVCTDTSYPFECEGDTCPYSNGPHTIEACAYGTQLLSDSNGTLDVLLGCHQINIQVDNSCIEILTPEPGEEVYGAVLITTEASDCIEWVEFYIDGVYKDTDFFSPFEYEWDTSDYGEDQQHTILVKAYHQGDVMCEREVTVIVNIGYVEILAPSEGDVVSGTVDITVYARGVDKIQYYFKECCIYNYDIQESDEPPYHYSWDTTQFPNGPCTISVKGYKSFELKDLDSVNCTISSQPAILLLGLLAGVTGFVKKRH
jgi:hypothetical protein